MYSNARDAKRTSTPRGIAHTDQGAWNVANHIAQNNALYKKHNQQHAYILGNPIRLAASAAKPTKKSQAQERLHPEQQHVFISQIHRDRRVKTLQHHRK
jgi:hypothetical protein